MVAPSNRFYVGSEHPGNNNKKPVQSLSNRSLLFRILTKIDIFPVTKNFYSMFGVSAVYNLERGSCYRGDCDIISLQVSPHMQVILLDRVDVFLDTDDYGRK